MTGTLVFPDKIHDIPVTKIKNNAFQSTNLNGKIQFPKFLTEIGVLHLKNLHQPQLFSMMV